MSHLEKLAKTLNNPKLNLTTIKIMAKGMLDQDTLGAIEVMSEVFAADPDPEQERQMWVNMLLEAAAEKPGVQGEPKTLSEQKSPKKTSPRAPSPKQKSPPKRESPPPRPVSPRTRRTSVNVEIENKLYTEDALKNMPVRHNNRTEDVALTDVARAFGVQVKSAPGRYKTQDVLIADILAAQAKGVKPRPITRVVSSPASPVSGIKIETHPEPQPQPIRIEPTVTTTIKKSPRRSPKKPPIKKCGTDAEGNYLDYAELARKSVDELHVILKSKNIDASGIDNKMYLADLICQYNAYGEKSCNEDNRWICPPGLKCDTSCTPGICVEDAQEYPPNAFDVVNFRGRKIIVPKSSKNQLEAKLGQYPEKIREFSQQKGNSSTVKEAFIELTGRPLPANFKTDQYTEEKKKYGIVKDTFEHSKINRERTDKFVTDNQNLLEELGVLEGRHPSSYFGFTPEQIKERLFMAKARQPKRSSPVSEVKVPPVQPVQTPEQLQAMLTQVSSGDVGAIDQSQFSEVQLAILRCLGLLSSS
jgi:hypothetical protein